MQSERIRKVTYHPDFPKCGLVLDDETEEVVKEGGGIHPLAIIGFIGFCWFIGSQIGSFNGY